MPASLNTKTATTCISTPPCHPQPPGCSGDLQPARSILLQDPGDREPAGTGAAPRGCSRQRSGSHGCEQPQGTFHSVPARHSSRSGSHDSRLWMRRGLFPATQSPSVQQKDTTSLFKSSRPCTDAGWHGCRVSRAGSSGKGLTPTPTLKGAQRHRGWAGVRGSPPRYSRRGRWAAAGSGAWGRGQLRAGTRPAARHTTSWSGRVQVLRGGGAVRCRRLRCGALGCGAVL